VLGLSNPVVGSLSAPGGGGGIEVTVSPDGHFVFVSLESTSDIAVFNLQGALTDGFSASDFVGTIPLGEAPVGMALAPDGRHLYATSETAGPAATQGSLSVIDLALAETFPHLSVRSAVTAGCGAVRVVSSNDGSVVWVTARGSDQLLGFSAAKLLADPSSAHVAQVEVGEAPVGVALVDSGAFAVVANSNRFSAPGATASLSIVDTAAALAGKPALKGQLASGAFPRQLALEPNGQTLLVTNFDSGQLEAVNVSQIPQ
jgi:DNA-binding beta-propeller fold protein YncE